MLRGVHGEDNEQHYSFPASPSSPASPRTLTINKQQSGNDSDAIDRDTTSRKNTSVSQPEDMEKPREIMHNDDVDPDSDSNSNSDQDMTIIHANEPEQHPPPPPLHTRTPSILSSFAPSPLRFSSFPLILPTTRQPPAPLPSSSSSSASSPLPTDPASSVLTARLRQERDEAISRLAYCSLEHSITIDTLHSELKDLQSGRDSLKHDLEQMVVKLIEGERAQAELEKLNDTLCQTESSYQQAKGRLATAYAELDELRSRLQEKEAPALSQHSQASSSCDCSISLLELKKENAHLREELLASKQQHRGASNLVISLQSDLDKQNIELEEQDRALNEEHQHSSFLRQELDQQTKRIQAMDELIHRESEQRIVAERIHREEVAALEDNLQDTQRQLQGAVNRALALQTQVDDQASVMSRYEQIQEALQSESRKHKATIDDQHLELKSATIRIQELEEENAALQATAQNLILVQLQARQALVDLATAAASRSDDHLQDDPIAQQDMHSLIVSLAETAKQVHWLQSIEKNMSDKLSTLQAEMEQLRAEKAAIEAQLNDSTEDAAAVAAMSEKVTALQIELDAAQQSIEDQRKHTATVESQLSLVESRAASLERTLQERDVSLSQLRQHLSSKEDALQALQKELENTQENLRIAEEEGRNLVADFNMLSEELENRQSEDETRSVWMYPFHCIVILTSLCFPDPHILPIQNAAWPRQLPERRHSVLSAS